MKALSLPLGALALTLAACSPSSNGSSADTGGNAAQASFANDGAPDAAPAPTPSPTAAAIVQNEQGKKLEYKLVIPAQAAAIPALRAEMLSQAKAAKAELLDQEAQDEKDMAGDGGLALPYSLDTEWKVVADTDQLLVLVSTGYEFQGGAHGSDFYGSLIWDRQADAKLTFGDLFTSKSKALDTIRKPFCKTLDDQRRKKRGGDLGGPDDFLTGCPITDEAIVFAPKTTVGGKFARIGVWIPEEVAGPHAEGDYTFDLVIPKAMIPLVKPKYRASFPTG